MTKQRAIEYTAADNDGTRIFVFGSNEAGIHGRGAAKQAKLYWGAEYGDGIGRTGMSYGIPTKDRALKTLPIENITAYVHRFLDYAVIRPELTFLVTKIGCGLSGYREEDVAPMFRDAPINCILPEGW